MVDGLVFENGHQFGIWRVFYEALSRIAEETDCILWLRSEPVQRLPPGVRVLRDAGRRPIPRWNLVGRTVRRIAKRFPAWRNQSADIFHSSYYTPCPWHGPSVVTVFDLIAERLFYLSPGWAVSDIALKRSAIHAASRCICISQTTANDLLSYYPELSGRIRVIPLGADHLIKQTTHSKSENSPGKFILFVGYREQYKNFWLLPSAMLDKAWPPDHVLHVVGSPAAEHELALLKQYGLLDRVRFLGRMSDADLGREYQSAACFVFPSLLEGFGLPVLEAQINGCPVALSDIPVFHEVAGDAAVFFDPRVGERLAEAVAIACEPESRRRLVEAGYENVRRFTWDHTAEQTLAVYQEVAALAR